MQLNTVLSLKLILVSTIPGYTEAFHDFLEIYLKTVQMYFFASTLSCSLVTMGQGRPELLLTKSNKFIQTGDGLVIYFTFKYPASGKLLILGF